MRIFSYRNRRRLHGFGIALLCLTLAAACCLLLRFLYLERYLVYTPRGAYLSREPLSDPAPQPPAAPIPVEIITIPAEEADAYAHTLRQISGVALSGALNAEPDAIRDAIRDARPESGTLAVMLSVKNSAGDFYYSSSVGEAAAVDITGMDGLLRSLRNDAGIYLIARVPAFADSAFALEHQEDGLPIRGGALWMDANGSYWLDPASERVRAHLIAELVELKELGFDEVVLDGFRFPDSANIVYDAAKPKSQIVSEAAAEIADYAAQLGIFVSFGTDDPDFTLPDAVSRVVLSDPDGASAAETAARYTSDPLRVLFLTDSRDTRFDAYSVLRPMTGE